MQQEIRYEQRGRVGGGGASSRSGAGGVFQTLADTEKFMQLATQAVSNSKRTLWAGHILSVLTVLFLLLDGVIKVLRLAPAVEATVQLGYPESAVVGIGIILLACIALYAIPRTSVLGAILLTGYLGGAIATHVRASSDLFPLIFPAILGVLLWGGLFLRDERLRTLIPLRKSSAL